MIDDEFIENEDLDDYVIDNTEEEEVNDENQEIDEAMAATPRGPGAKVEDYEGKMTKTEMELSNNYDNIVMAAKNSEKMAIGSKQFDSAVIDGLRNAIQADPKNTSVAVTESHVRNLLGTQGHNRIPQSAYTPDVPIRSNTVGEEFGGDDGDFNAEYLKEAKEQIANFVKYLDSRDLSKDSITSRNRKRRQLPAFIIFLFSSGLYDLILDCPTMPEEYQKMISNAFKQIQKIKYSVVEELAHKYEVRGRDKVAERVRKEGLSWFDHEPAVLKSLASYADLELTYDDILDYRSVRPRYLNASRSVTQDLISDFIEVVIEPTKMYEKLKDKTRADAIADVKKVYKDWSKSNPFDSELADKIIWKDIDIVK